MFYWRKSGEIILVRFQGGMPVMTAGLASIRKNRFMMGFNLEVIMEEWMVS